MILPFCMAATQLISVISHEEDLQNKSGHSLALGQGIAQPHKTHGPEDAGVKPSLGEISMMIKYMLKDVDGILEYRNYKR